MTDLLAELNSAARGVRQPHLDRLRALGVSIRWLAQTGMQIAPFGVAQSEVSKAGLYQVSPDAGLLNVIIPVVEDGALVDLCAFRTDDPGNWALRTGNGWALGLGQGMGEYMWGLPVHLYSDPLDWLRGSGEGICVLDWASPEIHRLDVLENVVCSDQATAALLQRALTRPVRVPNISVLEVAARDAA